MADTEPRPGFNHNDFYHRYLLRHVPPACDRALDIGCGTGLFARRLAQHARSVEAIDRAPEVITQARALSHGIPHIRYAVADLADYRLDTRYDFISCLASIHHVPFTETVTTLREALAPGGVLAILGCFRYSVPVDYLPDLVAAPTNLAANVAIRVRSRVGGRPTSQCNTAPVMEPPMTLPEIRSAASRLLPGAVIRRRLYWRYSLIYQRPSNPMR